MQGPGWRINADGTAYFNKSLQANNVTAFTLNGSGTLGNGGSLSPGGGTIGNGSLQMSGAGGGYIDPGRISAPGGNLDNYIESLAVGALTVRTSFNLFERNVDWREIQYVSNFEPAEANGWVYVTKKKCYVLSSPEYYVQNAKRYQIYSNI